MTSPLRICIVDDDFLFTQMLPRLLTRSLAAPEIVFYPARSFGEARELLAKQRVDVILSDYDLKTLETGLDVLEHAAQVAPEALRILISGHLPHELPEKGVRPYAAFVAKPMTLREMVPPLLAAISEGRGVAFQPAAHA